MVIQKVGVGAGSGAPQGLTNRACPWSIPAKKGPVAVTALGNNARGAATRGAARRVFRKGAGPRRTCTRPRDGGSHHWPGEAASERSFCSPGHHPSCQPLPLLNHLLLATWSRTALKDKAARWHSLCRHNPVEPAFGSLSIHAHGRAFSMNSPFHKDNWGS